jgi:hypothetical protein
MSLTNTIAYEGPRARGVSVKGMGILVAGLVLGAVIGLATATSSTTTDEPEASVTGMALDDFIRLNTTSLNGLAPAGVVESVAVDPGFVEMNTTSFDGLVRVASPQTVNPSFLEMNIGFLEYPTGGYAEPSNGFR